MEQANATEPTPLSASRLRAAFARMLGKPSDNSPNEAHPPETPAADAVTPEGIVEALLFVGEPDGLGRSAEAIAATIRDTSPEEIDEIVARLNDNYQRDESAYRIEHVASGYRLALADGLDRVGDRLRGRVRSTQLTPAALETLSVIAYRQPIEATEVRELCGADAVNALRQLIRLGLIEQGSGNDPEGSPPNRTEEFTTTDRFLRTLGLAGLEQLPRVAELDD